MAFVVPSFPDPHDPETPLANAYVWRSKVTLDVATGQGEMVMNVHPREATWQSSPVDKIVIRLGEVLAPGDGWSPPVSFPTIDEFMADPEFAAAYATIGAKLDAAAVARHPLLAGAVPV
jgi:hypothetical protein